MSTSPSSAIPATNTRSVQAVIVRCNGDQRRTDPTGLPWSILTVPVDHSVFWGTTPPLAARLNIPIAIHREGTQSTNPSDLDNRFVTYLNIDLKEGFAPSDNYTNPSLCKGKSKERHLARGMPYDECMTMNHHTCCPIVGRKPKKALPISRDPIVADEEKIAGGFLVSRAGRCDRVKLT